MLNAVEGAGLDHGVVRHVAEEIAQLRAMEREEIAPATTDNFFNCFKVNRNELHAC